MPEPRARIEFTWPDDSLARCDCFIGDTSVTVFFAHALVFPMKSEIMFIDHPLFSFHLREHECRS